MFSLSKPVSSTLTGRLYGINQTITVAWFGMIENDTKNFDRLIDLGEVWFAGGPSATKSVNSENYMIVYLKDDLVHRSIFHLLTIDVTTGHRSKILSDIKLDTSTNGSFVQIADDEKQIVGMREIEGTRFQVELATINKTNGQINVIGFYPYGTGLFDMVFARERRLYYTVHDSKLLCGINVDTGKLDIDILIPDDYSLQGLIYDSIKDRLLSIVYSTTFPEKAKVLAEIIIDNNSSTIQFQPIGNPTIPYIGYAWFSAYTIALKDRQMITIWEDDDTANFQFITIDIDHGNILTNQTIQPSPNLNSLVYFD